MNTVSRHITLVGLKALLHVKRFGCSKPLLNIFLLFIYIYQNEAISSLDLEENVLQQKDMQLDPLTKHRMYTVCTQMAACISSDEKSEVLICSFMSMHSGEKKHC